MGILDRADRQEIELLCQIYSEWKACFEGIANEGRVLRSVNKLGEETVRTHPYVRQASDAATRLGALLADVGMNPSARVQFGNLSSSIENGLAAVLGEVNFN